MRHHRSILGTLILTFALAGGAACHPAVQQGIAQDAEGPVRLVVTSETGTTARSAVAVLTITARLAVTNVTLQIVAPQVVGIDTAERQLALRPGVPLVVRSRLTANRPGIDRVDFVIRASAVGYDSAGTRERRYLDSRAAGGATIRTGREVRRDRRQAVADSIDQLLRTNPSADATLDAALRGGLRRLADSVQVQSPEQPLTPPAPGVEPYDKVVDRSANVLGALDPITVRGRFLYRDRAGTLRPFVNATVDIRDSDNGPDEQLRSVLTDWDGRFTAVVDNDDGWFQDGRDIFARLRTTNARFRAQDCSYWPDWTYEWETDTRNGLSDGTVVNFGNMELADYGEAAIIFEDLNQGWNFLTATGGQDPGFVDLCFPEDASVYSTFWEEIDIEDGDEVARDIVLHEYGHATMHNAYDGYWPSNTGGAHTFDDIEHRNLAFTEGWGTFIALSVNEDGVYNSNGWSKAIEIYSHSSGHIAGDGTRNEGHVVAGLGDIRDAKTDGPCTTTSPCDPSGASRAAMSIIWKDAFWRSNSDHLLEFWPKLCRELDDTQRTDAIRGLSYNETTASNCVCVISFALGSGAGGAAPAAEVQELRSFRDLALSKSAAGKRITDLYYRHTTEVAGLALRDPVIRRYVVDLSRAAAVAARRMRTGEGSVVLLDEKTAVAARQFAERLQALGSPDLKADVPRFLELVRDLEGKRAEEVAALLAKSDRLKD